MKIYNTLSKSKEDFNTITPNEVRMYVCGVTVYMPPHLGHARTYVAYDVIKEYLEFKGYKVFYVRNITDAGSIVGDADQGEDKIQLKANEMHVHPMELVDMNIRAMWYYLDSLRCARPNISPRATGHIIDIITAVQKMIDAGFAYELDGDVYCDVTKIKNYGILSGNTLDALNAGARIEVKSGKHSPYDFTVWKKAQDKSVLRWPSPWGEGYPGWHIECTVMSTKYLGSHFDIHGGGRDLAFPHHENEIAQSQALGCGMPANYWVHTGMLLAQDGSKMSKSAGNFVTIEDAMQKWGARSLRWFFVSGHYNSPIKYGDDVMAASNAGLERIDNFLFNLQNNVGNTHNATLSANLDTLKDKFVAEMDDDFNTPNAISAIFDFIKEANQSITNHEFDKVNQDEILDFFKEINKIFKCFDTLENKQADNRQEIVQKLIDERNAFRKAKDFVKADEIKAKILAMNVEILDNKDGTTTFRLK